MRTARSLLPVVHGAAGTVALFTIALFWIATVSSELAGDPVLIARVKQGIAWGLFVLVPAMAATGVSGRLLSGPAPRGLAGKKYRRMRIIAVLGILVLVPAALLLARWAAAGRFGPAFFAVQGAELAAGAVNFVLLVRNFRDGLRMRDARREGARSASSQPVPDTTTAPHA